MTADGMMPVQQVQRQPRHVNIRGVNLVDDQKLAEQARGAQMRMFGADCRQQRLIDGANRNRRRKIAFGSFGCPAAFARAAADAKRLGFDAVELHGAHGYLIDQFFWDVTNKRTDSYGGRTLSERARFAADVLKAVRAAVGGDFPVILRISQWKAQDFSAKLATNPEELEAWVAPLADAGVDVFHCSQRRFWEPEFKGSDLNLAGWVKKLTGKPTITVGSVGLDVDLMGSFQGEPTRTQSLDALLERLERGEFDLVAVGRALLNDPEWFRKIEDGRAHEFRGFDPKSLKTLR